MPFCQDMEVRVAASAHAACLSVQPPYPNGCTLYLRLLACHNATLTGLARLRCNNKYHDRYARSSRAPTVWLTVVLRAIGRCCTVHGMCDIERQCACERLDLPNKAVPLTGPRPVAAPAARRGQRAAPPLLKRYSDQRTQGGATACGARKAV